MKKQKVAIIGAGINGLYLAWKLSEIGHNVSVFERNKKIDNKICSGLFSERVLDFIPQSKKIIQNTINRAIIHFPKKTITLEFSKKFYVMNHNSLNELLKKLAEETGSSVYLNSDINSLREENKSLLFVKNKKFDKIIGSDGANSVVRRELNISEPKYRLGILGFLEKKSNLDYVETWPCKNGFIWKIPKGEKIEYGIIANPSEANEIFKSFLDKHNIQLKKIQSRIIPQGFSIPKHPVITVCGDAAGLTKPWSGGGVVWGLTAAEILLKNFPNFLNYYNRARSFFLPRIVFSKIIVKIVYYIGFRFSFLLPSKVKIESDFLL